MFDRETAIGFKLGLVMLGSKRLGPAMWMSSKRVQRSELKVV